MLATAVALALINIALASLAVSATGREVAPLWLGGLLLVVGLAAGVGAFVLWRSYLRRLRDGHQ